MRLAIHLTRAEALALCGLLQVRVGRPGAAASLPAAVGPSGRPGRLRGAAILGTLAAVLASCAAADHPAPPAAPPPLLEELSDGRWIIVRGGAIAATREDAIAAARKDALARAATASETHVRADVRTRDFQKRLHQGEMDATFQEVLLASSVSAESAARLRGARDESPPVVTAVPGEGYEAAVALRLPRKEVFPQESLLGVLQSGKDTRAQAREALQLSRTYEAEERPSLALVAARLAASLDGAPESWVRVADLEETAGQTIASLLALRRAAAASGDPGERAAFGRRADALEARLPGVDEALDGLVRTVENGGATLPPLALWAEPDAADRGKLKVEFSLDMAAHLAFLWLDDDGLGVWHPVEKLSTGGPWPRGRHALESVDWQRSGFVRLLALGGAGLADQDVALLEKLQRVGDAWRSAKALERLASVQGMTRAVEALLRKSGMHARVFRFEGGRQVQTLGRSGARS